MEREKEGEMKSILNNNIYPDLVEALQDGFLPSIFNSIAI